MVGVNSKKYFYESVENSLPNKHLLKNPKLIDIAVDALACFVPQGNGTIPKKLEAHLLKQNVEKEAFQEIVDFVAEKESVDEEGIQLIKFLEQEVIRYIADWFEALKSGYKWELKDSEGEDHLSNLRRRSLIGKSNTCCYSCGKVLERHSTTRSNSHSCSKRENISCFNQRKKLEKKEQKEWNFVMSKQKCAHCGSSINLSLDKKQNSVHDGLYFCPPNKFKTNKKSCYEAYRKKQLRISQYLNLNK